ncbi:zinc metalloprotease [Myxococcus sp. CA056]|uniref:zinc metalloprotease n=1 Tax=Myxococcus sp. CA056 TaxID=2741740 RepID=UPI00157B3276|nr:zinc metalloprotease [Myxococcus sp. CA056]NTX13488.1 zinc metalloprotease [Myxococcus sp. CA056]
MERSIAKAIVLVSLVAWGCGGGPEPLEADITASRCGTEEPSEETLTRVAQESTRGGVSAMRLPGSVRVPTYVHVIRRGTGIANGDVPLATILAQLEILSAAYAATPFWFDLMSVTRTTNATSYVMAPGSAAEAAAKNALHQGGKESLNLYLANPGNGLLAWATFPWGVAEAPLSDGVVLLNAVLPGGTASPYALGDTAVHEVGHWLGLLHTMAGCTTDDGVSDTSRSKPTYTCVVGGDSCPTDVGLDPVRNYMGYVDDACMSEFTPGQSARMDSMALMYR